MEDCLERIGEDDPEGKEGGREIKVGDPRGGYKGHCGAALGVAHRQDELVYYFPVVFSPPERET